MENADLYLNNLSKSEILVNAWVVVCGTLLLYLVISKWKFKNRKGLFKQSYRFEFGKFYGVILTLFLAVLLHNKVFEAQLRGDFTYLLILITIYLMYTKQKISNE